MAIRQKTEMTIKLTARGTSHARSEIEVDGLTTVIDEPVARRRHQRGTLAHCHGLFGADRLHQCHRSQMRPEARYRHRHLSFEMEVDFDRRGVLLIHEVDVPFKACA